MSMTIDIQTRVNKLVDRFEKVCDLAVSFDSS